jgi:putative ABC transport system permease protein
MLRHYFKSAFRNLLHNKGYAAINITGIAIGLTAFWLIALYVGDELSYDRYHANGDRIYRVVQHASWTDNDLHLAPTSAPFAPALKNNFPEIEEACRIIGEGGGTIGVGEKKIKAGDIFFADNNTLTVFDYPFIAGDPHKALATPESIVLTETLATTLFGNAATALGKTVYFENNYPNTVSGVIKDIPVNSHIRFSGLRSFPANYTTGWQQFNLYTYILLKKNTDVAALEKKLPAFADATIKKEMGVKDYKMELQPITSIHLHSNLQFEAGANGNMSRVYIFIAIAALILIIAIINYMNLSSARSSARIREIGVRKVIGSERSHLAGLFIMESLVVTFLAAGVAFFLVNVLLPLFNHLSGKELTLWRFGTITTTLAIIAFAALTGIISGLYPSFLLSRFKTIPALKGQMGNIGANLLFRKSLVVFQFMITVFMIGCSGVIYQQMQYALHKDLGFNKEQVLTFHIHDREARKQVAALKAKLLQSPLIEGAAAAGNPIGNNDLGGDGYRFETKAGDFQTSSKMVQELMVDPDYLNTMDIKLAAGRNLSTSMTSDKYGSMLINETLANELGWKDPVGKRAQVKIDNKGNVNVRTIVGVIKDFHTYSLQHKVAPLVMLMPPASSMEDNLYVKLKKGAGPEALAYIEKVYKEFDNSNPVELNFLDQNFARQYAAEQKQEELSLIFTILAVLIASLGLLGLTAFAAQQRLKEIGIRKVLGASVTSITAMLSRDFIKLVGIAILIATPIAWLAMDQWLQDFAYRVSVQWWVFALAGVLSLMIALATVSIHAIRAALANPVKSLRSE